MPAGMLSTKLFIPPPGPRLVQRPRLTQRLNDALTRPLTLLSAPAGFGKTTLLVEWYRGAGRRLPLAWLSLDADDNDPAQFLKYFVAAIETLRPRIGGHSLTVLPSPHGPALRAFFTELTTSLNAVSDDFAVVLDDYHLISSSPIHDSIAFLLDRLPPKMHLVIASRADPPLPIARLRARGQLTEIRAADLRFTREEAGDYLNRLMNLNLPAADVAALEARTEGWITGLQLAALSMQRRDDLHGFIQAFAGDDRYVLDYLVEEVLQRQPHDVKAFLLQTSILSRLTGPLCEAVTRQDGGQDTLEHLEQANLFIVPLDGRRLWYRYHHLFAEFLRARLHREQPGHIAELHRRASKWQAENGLTEDAVDHALSATTFEVAADLIEHIAERMFWKEGRTSKLLEWLAALPDDIVRSRPTLSLTHAWALLASGQADRVEATLVDVERAAEASHGGTKQGSPVGNTAMLGDVALIRAMLARSRGDYPTSLTLGRQAVESMAGGKKSLLGFAVELIGSVHQRMGDVRTAAQVFASAAQMSKAAGNFTAALLALGRLVDVQAAGGQLRTAAATYQRTVELAATWGLETSPALGVARLGMGRVLTEWNDLFEAEQHLRKGIDSCHQWGGLDEAASLTGYFLLSRVLQARGDVAGARGAIDQIEVLSHRYDMPEGAAVAGAEAARLSLRPASRNLVGAVRWAASLEDGVMRDEHPTHTRGLERLALARVLIEQTRLADAAALLDRMLESAEAGGNTGRVIETLLLQAITRQAEGNMAQAVLPLSRALSLGEPEGYVRVFLDDGVPVVRLLREAESRGVHRDYARRLLAAFGDAASSRTPVLVNPLSERELEVLRLVAAGLSPQEIGEKLFITIGTVRNHVKNIYSKLDAHNRLEAVNRARAVDLL